MSSRRSFMSSAAIAAAASVSGCAVTAPAAAAICRAAPYVLTIDAPLSVAPAGAIEASPVASAAEAVASVDAKLLELYAKFQRLTASNSEAWERYCSLPEGAVETKALNDEIEARYHAWAATSDACYATQPRTTAGALALLNVILERDGENIDPIILKPMYRLRDGLAAMVQS
jgi:hypothetical protein